VESADIEDMIHSQSTVLAMGSHSIGCNESLDFTKPSKRERDDWDSAEMEGDSEHLKSKLKRMDTLACCFDERNDSPDGWVEPFTVNEEDDEIMYRYEETDHDDEGYMIVAEDSVYDGIE
jgi:hypothetical protein